ncbi:MAG: 2-oxo acid dehydrogenase subunit E2 [Clostridia bacterium]|nr:2-oxo acid dehydrogenase subunit E2 [Clostridia bacterium]
MRKDGKRLKNAEPMYTVAAHIMSKRTDSMNMITIDVPLEPIQKYINEKRKQGIYISHMAVILSAFMQTVAEYPQLNRFVVNSNIYARNELAVGMVVLKSGETSDGTMSKMYFRPDNTVFEVNDIINKYVEENRNAPENNGTEKAIKVLLGIPGLLRIGVKICKFLDNHNLLPSAIVNLSPFHNTLVISNLASIRTNHIYHHIYDFGTTSIMITMGNSREVAKRKGGEIVFEKCMPLGIVMDERICSGSYFAIAFRKMKQFLTNPEMLETKPKEVKVDDGI